MPALVRGGRRQGAPSAPARGKARPGRGQRPRNVSGVPGKFAAVGRLDLTPTGVAICLAAGLAVLGVVLATGSRGERIAASVTRGVDGLTTGMGLALKRVHITGASAEATPAIQNALNLHSGQAITSLDLDALQTRVAAISGVREARVVRLLPDTLIVEVKEFDRLAVWQSHGQASVVDSGGRVIEGADPGRYPNLPLIVGAGANDAAAALLPLLAQRPRLMSRVDAAVRVDGRRWDLRLKDGSLIQLPAVDQGSALLRLDALDQRERLLDLGFARVDLRAVDTVAVRPAGAAA